MFWYICSQAQLLTSLLIERTQRTCSTKKVTQPEYCFVLHTIMNDYEKAVIVYIKKYYVFVVLKKND